MTKRLIFSMVQRLFDPIGATLMHKLWLQSLWKNKLRWDKVVDGNTEKAF